MVLKQVVSTSLSEIGYDVKLKALVVKFRHGGAYAYHGVPRSVYRALLAARSLGEYFSTHVRGHYPFTKLEL